MDSRSLDTLGDHFAGKRVVVTGGAGSIGSQICRDLISLDIATLTIVSLTESGLYKINRTLRAMKGSTDIRPVLGSVTDEKFIQDTVWGQDIVIHAAAHKHVPICEENPIEAIRNNVFGTRRLIDACVEADVLQFMLVSTDKAVRPLSVMGRTKAVAEQLAQRARFRQDGPHFNVVRFGNVLDSDGSVMPLWREQIAAGGPVTVTDERCTRYFMSIPEASMLVLHSLGFARPGTYVFDMGEPRKMVDIANELIQYHAEHSFGPKIDIKITGLRQGEKIHEELHVGGALEPTSHPKINRLLDPPYAPLSLVDLGDLEQAVLSRNEGRALAILTEMTDAR